MYIISLKHTSKEEKFMTLWRPNNSGYCYSAEQAGFYEPPEKGYHDDKGNLPAAAKLVESLLEVIPYSNGALKGIPNVESCWQQLGLKMVKNRLVRVS